MNKMTINNLKGIILADTANLLSELSGLRRHFHMNPELSFEEHETAGYICSRLDEYGIPYRKGITGTGIIAEIKGSLEGDTVIALRAEMDALPVIERNKVPYASRTEGRMHACGHDAHMAMLLVTARMLKSIQDKFGGTVLLVFQPGEELSPGGARIMIESGALKDPEPDIVIAHHVLPELETGKVGYKAGMYMASSDEIYITVTGTGGHAALPHLVTDQIYLASKLIIRIKDEISAISEEKKIPTVLGIGRIRGDGATNVIPETVEISGTLRTFDEEWRKEAKEIIRRIAGSIEEEYGVRAEVRFAEGYPVLVNNKELTSAAMNLSRELLGNDNVETFDLRMSSEDFAFFSAAFPSLYYRIGIKKEGEKIRMLHSPDFDIDEEGMITGVANMCWLAINFLKNVKKIL